MPTHPNFSYLTLFLNSQSSILNPPSTIPIILLLLLLLLLFHLTITITTTRRPGDVWRAGGVPRQSRAVAAARRPEPLAALDRAGRPRRGRLRGHDRSHGRRALPLGRALPQAPEGAV